MDNSEKPEAKRLLSYLSDQKGPFSLSLFAMVIYGATDGAVPFLIKAILDKIFAEKNTDALYLLPVVLVAFGVVRGASGFFQKYLTAKVGLEIIRKIRGEICEKLLSLSPAYYNKKSSGDLVSSMTNDTLLVRAAITDSAAALVRDTIRIIALASAALYLDPILGLIAIVGLPLGVLPVIRFGKRVRKLSKVGQGVLGGVTSNLSEVISGNRVIQNCNQQDRKLQEFEEENKKFTLTFQKAEKYGALSAPTNEIIACLAISAVIVYGGFSVISGVRSQGDFVAFLTSLFLMYEPVKKLGRVNATLQQGLAAATRIFSILDTKPLITEKSDAKHLVDESVGVQFDSVCFSYAGPEQRVVSDFNLSLPIGTKTALVGESGGGKSTMAKLLLREYDVTSGSIKINGHDLRDLSLSSLRRSLAYVEQDPFLFNTSVLENIRFAKPEASRSEVLEACDAANALEFVSNLPEGVDTPVGERGTLLSGGQRARIAIARAILKNAPLLILDEATASLDSESEKLVQEAIEVLMKGRTSLVIAHRLATVLDADQIIVLKSGKIVERGTHTELSQSSGYYSQLSKLQKAV